MRIMDGSMPNLPKCTEKKLLLFFFSLADSCQLLRPSGTSSMRGGYLAPLIEELAAVRLTEESCGISSLSPQTIHKSEKDATECQKPENQTKHPAPNVLNALYCFRC